MNTELIAQMISTLKVKNDMINNQVVQLTLLVEHLYEKLSEAESKNNINLNLDLDNYSEWVDKRMKSLSEELEKQNLDEIGKNIADEIDTLAKEINLNESE